MDDKLYISIENNKLKLYNQYRHYFINLTIQDSNIDNDMLLKVIEKYIESYGNCDFRIEMTSINHCYLIFKGGFALQISPMLGYEITSKMILLNTKH